MENIKNEIATIDTSLSKFDITCKTLASKEFETDYGVLVDYINQLNMIKTAIDEKIKGALEENYFLTGESTIQNDKFSFTYKPSTTRESLDSKLLKTQYPDLYINFVKVSDVKSSVTIKEKKPKEEEI